MSNYTEDQLMQDVRDSSRFFEDILEKELARLKQNILIDYRVAKPGWELPYNEIIDMSKRVHNNSTKLQEALDEAKAAMSKLNIAVEQEISMLRMKTTYIIKSIDQVNKLNAI